jgi:hypothetical protein
MSCSFDDSFQARLLCAEQRVVARCTALSTHTTCCHNTALLITMYVYWLFLQKCNLSQAQCKLPEDGPSRSKHVGANIRYFNVKFNILYVQQKVHLLVKRNFNDIKMHGTTITTIKGHLFRLGPVDSPRRERCRQTLKWPHTFIVTVKLAVLRFRYLGYHFLKLGDIAVISVSKVVCRGCWMLKQRVAPKIGNGWGARPTAVPALMYSNLYCTLTWILAV